MIDTEKRRVEKWVYLIYLSYGIVMDMVCYLKGIPLPVILGLSADMLLAGCIIYSNRFSRKFRAYTMTVISCINITIYSIVSGEYTAVLITIGALAIMLGIYRIVGVYWLMMGFTAFLSFYHWIFLDTFDGCNAAELLSFMLRGFSIFLIELFGIILVSIQISMSDQMEQTIHKLEKEQKAKDDFLANMSHEIRTPMNAVCGMSELILRESGLSDSVQENAFNIQMAGRSLLGIINDILDFSKIQSGKMTLAEEAYNIASVLNDVINLTMARKGDKKLEVIVDCEPNIPSEMIGDETRIKQIILNLMTNAVKYTKEGMIVLQVSSRRESYGVNLCISVSDTGIGISKKDRDKLFGSFSQLDTRKNRTVEGTGLGLAICKQLITMMGGFIHVISQYGEGSSFTFIIPQKITNPAPFVHLNHPEQLNVAGYIRSDKYKFDYIADRYTQLFSHIVDSLNLRWHRALSLSTLKELLKAETVTHLFLSHEEYREDKVYFCSLIGQTQIVVVQDREYAEALPPGMLQILKPFYLLPITNVLNGEKLRDVLNRQAEYYSGSFTAPEAHILVVDDNEMNLKVSLGLLRAYEIQASTASSGAQALQMLEKEHFDMVFMDHMMPKMDGVEATEIIRSRSDQYSQTVPIIALTANAINGVREMFLQHGFQDFVAKPVEPSFLERVLKKWLPKEKLRKPYANTSDPKLPTSNLSFPFRLIDSTLGLRYSGNNLNDYISFLRIYEKDGIKSRQKINQAYEREDWKDYAIYIHALKSTSMSIGATALSDAARELEKAAKEDNRNLIKQKHLLLAEQHQAVLSEIRGFLNNDAFRSTQAAIHESDPFLQQSAPEIKPDKDAELEFCSELLNIKELIHNFDQNEAMSRIKAFMQLPGCMASTALLKDMRSIQDKLSNFEFDAAASETAALLQRYSDAREREG